MNTRPRLSPHVVTEEALDSDTLKLTLRFNNNQYLAQLMGVHDRYLVQIEKELGIQLGSRGNIVVIEGGVQAVELAKTVLTTLYNQIGHEQPINSTMVSTVIRMIREGILPNVFEEEPHPTVSPSPNHHLPSISTRKGLITARTAGQAEYLNLLAKEELVFSIGPAGTGKTFLAVAQAVSLLLSGQVDRIILSRPAVEAGERLGFLPGDMKDKIDPYLRPLYDALHNTLPGDQLIKRLTNGEIEVAPLAFMRGRTLEHAYVILDEAQNTTCAQMKMFLTRLGPGSKMVITGDLTQIDLPSSIKSGLQDAVEILEHVKGIKIMRFTAHDVVRHPLVSRIVRAYDQENKLNRKADTPQWVNAR
ncbi:PhoH-like protein [Commensalibacter sp. Nvir]|uniref:PhoH family protein n=1 Tax=Commensalibacter sp. Nvir TaxID=3069817 RepID=UPI002D4F74A1|nr:PhoH-like protein [Commensalibacter sp. Nvir]